MTRLLTAGAILLSLIQPSFGDTLAATPVNATAGSDSRPYVIGWQFAVTAPVTVTGLAYLDSSGVGLAEAHRVAIFDNAGNILISSTVPAGSSAPFENGFRVSKITYSLQPGTYVIAGQRPSNADAAMVRASSVQTIAQIKYLEEREIQSPDFVFPSAPFSLNEAGSFGPSFTVSDTSSAPRSISSVVNSGSFQSSFTSGSYLTLFGTNLSTGTRTWNASDFKDGKSLPTSLDGISVTVNGIPAYVEYISSGQLNIILPDMPAAPAGVAVTVKSAGQPDTTAWIQIKNVAPDFFAWATGTADTGKYVVAQHADGTNAGKLGLFPQLAPGFTTPVRPGETIVLYGIGFGGTTPAFATGQIADKAYPVSTLPIATLGGRTAAVAYAGLVASLSSVYQVNLTVPADMPDGDWPLVVSVGGSTASTPVLLTVAH